MIVRVDVAPALYEWAAERSGVDADELHRKFPRLPEWEAGDQSPTLKQLEGFARATKTPVGYFFLSEPPDDEVPIPDLCTFSDRGVVRPSPDLLDTIYQCQQRQDWYRDYARSIGLDPVSHVGSLSTAVPVEGAASVITAALSFSVEQRGANWSEAFACLRDQAEDAHQYVVVIHEVFSPFTEEDQDPLRRDGWHTSHNSNCMMCAWC